MTKQLQLKLGPKPPPSTPEMQLEGRLLKLPSEIRVLIVSEGYTLKRRARLIADSYFS
jgi:hypothetical protein